MSDFTAPFSNQFRLSPEIVDAKSLVDLQNPSAGLSGVDKNVDNNPSNVEQAIANIANQAQTLVEHSSIMGRGLSYTKFFASAAQNNWNQSFPYRLLVLKVDRAGNYSEVAAYRLPINPQELTIVNRFAIKTTITSRGVLEEHNGMPLKQIVINGTTGILLPRPSGDQSSRTSPGVIGSIFGGTLDAVSAARSQFQSFTSGAPNFKTNSLTVGNADPDDLLKRSGFYQYHMLRLFVETYAEVKKLSGSSNLRLALEIPKDNAVYIVSPEPDGFTTRRTVQSPMEYFYTLKFLAWGTIADYHSTSSFGPNESAAVGPITRDIGNIQTLFNKLSQLRKTVTAFKNIVSAARADVESNIFGPINSTILLTKDLLSIPKTIADFPKSLRDSFQTSVIANWDSLSRTNEDLKRLFNTKMESIINEGSGSSSFIGTQNEASKTFKTDVLDDLTLTDTIQIGQLPITQAQQNAIDDATDSALSINNNDILNLVGELQKLSDALESEIKDKNALDPEWDLLYDTEDTISELYAAIADGDFRVSTKSRDDSSGNAFLSIDPLQFWQQSADNANIPFEKSLGKFSVPFPFRGSLEALASVYLGDATRWMEIAALNGLQYPYIDEDGFYYSFTGNGNLNQFNVSSDVNLYVGQSIFITSNAQLVSKRKILAIAKITDTNFIITVDGASNLSSFRTSDSAKMKAFLPYTINSLRQIFIPSAIPPGQEDVATKTLTFLKDDEDLIKFAKIDFLLDSAYDLSFTQDGFLNLAFGTSNLIQAAKIKVKTVKDSLLLHPGWGAGVPVGESVANINLKALADQINNAFISDPRYNVPSKIDLELISGALIMNLVASVKRENKILPITLPLTSV